MATRNESPQTGAPSIGGESPHLFFELGDHLSSTSVVLDKATSELVERSTYKAYGATESDCRPGRLKCFREDDIFAEKEGNFAAMLRSKKTLAGGSQSFAANPADFLPDEPHKIKSNSNRLIQPSENLRIRAETHPQKPGEMYASRHYGQHYHAGTRINPNISWNNSKNVTKVKPPNYKPGEGTGFLPGEPFPGQ